MKCIIKNAFIVSNGKRDTKAREIYIQDGIIKKIGEKIDEIPDKEIDAKGMFVLPGFIDIECKMPENGYESKNNLQKLGETSAKGGFTTVATSSSIKPIVDDRAIVEYILSKTKNEKNINIFPFGNMTKGGMGKEIAEIGEMLLTGAVAISDGGQCIDNITLLRDIFLYSKMFDVRLVTSASNVGIVEGGTVNYGYMATKLGLLGIPREAEEIEIAKNIILAKYTGAKVHISNITTKGSVKLIKDAKADGVDITCSTAPHYFSLSDKAIDNYNTLAKVMPPLREEDDIQAIKQGIQDGTIDAITSGHAPVLKEKKHTEFERAEYGISGLEVAFNIVNTNLLKAKNIGIEYITLLMSKTPAKILNLHKKGEIKEGYDADIIILDENKKSKIDSNKFVSRAKYSPYDGQEVHGEIITTMVRGNVVYSKNNNY